MLAGMSKEEKKVYDLTTASDYVYLNQVRFERRPSESPNGLLFLAGWHDLL